jgi:hypothetical protein
MQSSDETFALLRLSVARAADIAQLAAHSNWDARADLLKYVNLRENFRASHFGVTPASGGARGRNEDISSPPVLGMDTARSLMLARELLSSATRLRGSYAAVVWGENGPGLDEHIDREVLEREEHNAWAFVERTILSPLAVLVNRLTERERQEGARPLSYASCLYSVSYG